MQWAQEALVTAAALAVRKFASFAPPPPNANINIAMAAPDTPGPAGPNLDQLKGAISQRKLVLWFVVVAIAFVLSAGAILLSPFLTAGFELAVIFCAFVWGCVFGFLIVFILPPKVITAIAGAIFGGGAQNWATGQGYVTKLQDWAIASAPASAHLDGGFIRFAVGLTVVLVGLLCLPAFFRE